MVGDGKARESAKPALYEINPPSWLPQFSDSVELGFQGFHPPRPGQDEDLLTEANIRQGYQTAPVVPAESFTSKALVIGTLTGKDGDPIAELGDFMNEIFKRREESMPQLPPSTFRIPQRLTLPETKKQAWFADLANPDIPLYKLGKSIPHGVRGPDLLDLLHSSNVPIARAVWFVRVLGCIEATSQKSKTNYNPFQCSVEWANTMNIYLKRQIMEIVLPSAPRAGLMIKQSFKGVWTSPEARERWVSKISYSLDLLHVLYAEYMVDHTAFLAWLVQFLFSCNLAQATFIARIAHTYVKDMFTCRALTKMLIDACLSKLQEIITSTQKHLLQHLQSTLVTILRQTFYEAPHAFISPRVWAVYSALLKPILTLEDIDRPDDDTFMKTSVKELKQYLRAQLNDIEQRNEALLFRLTSEPTQGCLRSAVSDAQLLNTITTSTDFGKLDFFGTSNDTSDYLFSRKLDLLLSWCTSPLQFGPHRPYAAVTLLRIWRDKAEERANIHDFISPQELLQDELFDWLDTSDLAGDVESVDSVSLLYGDLVESGLFSYDLYFQRLIARGEAGLSFEEGNGSRHRMILRTIPLHSSSAALVNQRKFALYGVRVKHSSEEATEKEMRRKIRLLLPEVFGGILPDQLVQMELLDQLSSMKRSRFEQVRVVKQWLLPALQKHLSKLKYASAEHSFANVRLFSTSMAILETVKCFRSMLDITLRILKVIPTNDLLAVIIDILRHRLEIWACMNKMPEIMETVYGVHRAKKSRGEHVRPLVTLILDMDNGHYLDPSSKHLLVEEAAHYAQALCPADDNPDPVPNTLPEILMLSQDPIPDAPSSLCNTLWYKYRTSRKWTWVVWDNVIASLRQVPAIMLTRRERYECARKYAQFLLHVNEHSADGIDIHALTWFVGPGQNEIVSMTSEAWEVCIVVFIQLAVNGALKITTLLEGVIYPAWIRGAQADTAEKGASGSVSLHAAYTLLGPLLLYSRESVKADGALPPTDLVDMQRLKARRGEVFLEPHFRRLIDMFPALVLIQNSVFIEEACRARAQELIVGLCKSPEFSLATSRYFNAVLSTFVKALEPGTLPEEMHNSLMTTLHLVFNNGTQGDMDNSSKISSSILSPWKLSATCALTKFDLRQIAKRMEAPATKEQAEAELTQLVDRLLHSNISAEEAEFIIEMTKGVNKIVAGKFLNCGLHRISLILEEAESADVEVMQSMTERADHFLTLLSSIAGPTKGDISEFAPRLDADVQNEFMPKLLAKLKLLESSVLKYVEETELGFGRRPPMTSSILFIARLVQFDLGFEGIWTDQTREVGSQLLLVILRLASLYGGSVTTDSVAFSMLIDTAFYIFDELPLDPPRQNVPTDIFQHCPSYDENLLPPHMPPSYKGLIQTLFRHSIHSKSEASPIDGIPPAQLRPWEWLEYLGDQPLDPKEQAKEQEDKKRARTKHIIRNNASLSLELFDAQITGESVRNVGPHGDALTWMFEDGLVAESVYERAWRSGHVTADSDKATKEVGTRGKSSSSRGGTPFRASPALSTRSSVGGVQSVNSSRPSPFGRDPMDIDNLYPPVAGDKRKASAAGIGDDDDASRSQASGASQGSGVKGKGKAKSRHK